MITRTDWWLGVLVLTAAILLHAAFPRFEIKGPPAEGSGIWRIDRWTGQLEITASETTPWLKITK